MLTSGEFVACEPTLSVSGSRFRTKCRIRMISSHRRQESQMNKLAKELSVANDYFQEMVRMVEALLDSVGLDRGPLYSDVAVQTGRLDMAEDIEARREALRKASF
jgi:hypothetical protein